MNTVNEFMLNFRKLDIQKEISEGRLMKEPDARDYVALSKISSEYVLYYELYTQIAGGKNNPYKIRFDSITQNGVEYVIRESLDAEIERIWKAIYEFNAMSEMVLQFKNRFHDLKV